jgi:HSP20 family protein
MNIVLRGNGGRSALMPYYRPWSLLGDLEALSSELWNSSRPGLGLAPHMDMYEEKGKLIVKTELPGIKSEDLDVKLEGGTLSIRAERKEEVKEDKTHHTRERYYGQYFRSVKLPYPVREDKVSATLEEGVLEIRLPKAEEVEAKKIEVKAQLPEGETKKRQRKPRQKKS